MKPQPRSSGEDLCEPSGATGAGARFALYPLDGGVVASRAMLETRVVHHDANVSSPS